MNASWRYLSLIGGVCCISTSAILVTLADVAPTVSAFYRNFFAALIWFPLFRRSRATWYASQLRKECCAAAAASPILKPRPMYLFLLLGLLFAADLWFWHRCIINLGAGPATLMGNLQVLFVALLALLFFNEKLKPYYWHGALLALVGIALLTLTNGVGTSVAIGLLQGLATATTYAFFLIILKLLADCQIPPSQTLFWISALTGALLAPVLWLEKGGFLLSSLTAYGWLLLHALVSSVIGWWLIIRALRLLPVSISSTLLLLQPILTSLWGHLFLGQTLSGVQVAGILVALAGIRLANH